MAKTTDPTFVIPLAAGGNWSIWIQLDHKVIVKHFEKPYVFQSINGALRFVEASVEDDVYTKMMDNLKKKRYVLLKMVSVVHDLIEQLDDHQTIGEFNFEGLSHD